MFIESLVDQLTVMAHAEKRGIPVGEAVNAIVLYFATAADNINAPDSVVAAEREIIAGHVEHRFSAETTATVRTVLGLPPKERRVIHSAKPTSKA